MDKDTLPFLTRLWFAWVAWFQVLFHPTFASRVWELRQLPPPVATAPRALASVTPAAPQVTDGHSPAAALTFLALLQREGRFVDFLEQDIAPIPDADVAAAARVVHEGCRRALHAHAVLEPIRQEEEGTAVTLEDGFSPFEIKLSGDIRGKAPYRGQLRHRGWRAVSMTLPVSVAAHDPRVLAPAEVEL